MQDNINYSVNGFGSWEGFWNIQIPWFAKQNVQHSHYLVFIFIYSWKIFFPSLPKLQECKKSSWKSVIPLTWSLLLVHMGGRPNRNIHGCTVPLPIFFLQSKLFYEYCTHTCTKHDIKRKSRNKCKQKWTIDTEASAISSNQSSAALCTPVTSD